MIINKNILTVKRGIICHQVNCKGKMGAGIALNIKKKWIIVYTQYLLALKEKILKLGEIQIVKISPFLYIANLAGQDSYGRDKQYTDYNALTICFSKLQKVSDSLRLQIYIPYKIGCANAGGDWLVVEKIINDTIKNPMICKL